MGINPSSPVHHQPAVTLIWWAIVEDKTGNCFFSGLCLESALGRFSSPIIGFDLIRRLGVTASGRTYQLLGEPDEDDAAECVIEQVFHHTKVELRDITNRVISGEKQLPKI